MEGYVIPSVTTLDGREEVDMLLSQKWEEEVGQVLKEDVPWDERGAETSLLAMRDSVKQALPSTSFDKEGTRSMEVWCSPLIQGEFAQHSRG